MLKWTQRNHSELSETPALPVWSISASFGGKLNMKQEHSVATRRSHNTSAHSRILRYAWVGLFTVIMALMVTAVPMAAQGGRILIAGYGPELPIIQDLARVYEKEHPGTAIDIEWDKALRAVEKLKQGEAQIAVTDRPVAGLRATQIAWDGIAVIVNFANPVREVTTSEVKALFSGQISRWSDLDGADRKV